MNETTGKCFCHLNGYEVKDAKARKAIEEIKTTMNASKKYLFIGDSYMAHETNILTSCVNVLGLTSDDYYKYATGGYGFVSASAPGTFLTLLNDAISAISNKEEIEQIVVCGGLNDCANTESAVVDAIQTFVTLAKSAFVNATVKIGFVGCWKDASKIGAQTGRVIMQMKKGAINAGASWLHGLEYAMHDYRMVAPDNLHPKDASVYSYLGKCIAQAILTGKCSVNMVNYERTLTPATGFTISLTRPFSVVETIDDGLATFTLAGDLQLVSTEGVKLTYYNPVLLGTLNDGLIMGGSGTYCTTPVFVNTIIGVKNSGTTENCAGFLYISDNKLYFVPMQTVVASSSNYQITSIILPRFTLAMPSTYC